MASFIILQVGFQTSWRRNVFFAFHGRSGRFRKTCRKDSGSLPEAYRKPKTHMFISLQFRKVPEAYRKSYRKLVSGGVKILPFRKLPEAHRKNVRKRFRSSSLFNTSKWTRKLISLWFPVGPSGVIQGHAGELILQLQVAQMAAAS